MALILIVHSSRVAAAMITNLLRDQDHEVLNALTLDDAEAALNHCDVDGMVAEVRHLQVQTTTTLRYVASCLPKCTRAT
jgi:response regulator RpfG family c-di-GMP phosphodiesterase